MAHYMNFRRFLKGCSGILSLSLLLSVTVDAQTKKPLRCVQTEERLIALTFDDGPSEKYTEEILSVLEEYGIPATFFVIGENCRKNPDILRLTVDKGHQIGNHTDHHPIGNHLTGKYIREEIMAAEKTVMDIIGKKTVFFRPPGGCCNEEELQAVADLSYTPVLWTVDTKDWKCPAAEVIAETVLRDTRPGYIILCHDYTAGKSNTAAAMRIFIPKILAQGYRFVTVSELLDAGSGK